MLSNYLLDTHCLIWFQENNNRISPRVMDIIQNPENTIFITQVSLFEIAIKQSIGKLPDFTANTDEIYHLAIKKDFIFIPIHNKHISAYKTIPFLEQHRDPFDRLILATAYEENMIVLTADKNFSLYPDLVTILW